MLLDGQLLPADTAHLELPNRGLQFNDGFFETLVGSASAVRYLPEHLTRMRQAAAALRLELPAPLATADALHATLTTFAATALPGAPAVRLRLQLWRQGGGLYAPTTAAAHWLLTAASFTPNDAPIEQAGWAEAIRTQFSPVSFCKGPYALHYVLAAQERDARGLDELFLLDAHGHVAEAVAAAVFWIRGDALYTPALSTGCVAGVRRAHLLQVARAHGLPCHEGQYPPAELHSAEAVFTANVAGIRAVRRLGERRFGEEAPLLEELRGWEAER